MSFAAARRIVLRGHRHLRTSSSAAAGHQISRSIFPSAAAAVSFPSSSFHNVQQQQHQHPLSFSQCCMSTMAAAAEEEQEVDDDNDTPLFSSIPNLHPSSLHAIEQKMKLSTMTEIQHKTFEAASGGRDILGRARTGTGKTLAFLLPAIENALRLGRVPGPLNHSSDGKDGEVQKKGGIATLILSPTRELAMQIHSQAQILAASHANGLNGDRHKYRMASQVMYGGSSRNVDLQKLEDNTPFILVATPGRLIDHMQNSYINGTPFSELIGNVSVCVLDEADRCLDMGFRKDMEYIMGFRKQERQTLLFSATLPKDLRAIMASHMQKNYLTVDCVHDVDPATHTNSNVDQSFVTLPPLTKNSANSRWISGMVDILEDIVHIQNPTDYKIVVFFPTTNMCQFFSHIINSIYKIPNMEIHSKKTQSNRTYTSDKFRKFKQGILFTTDVSARGVDYPDVTHVIQYGSAENRETYIHRLGRTGRAGKRGRGIIIVGGQSEERQFVTNELQGLDVKRDERYQGLIAGEIVAEEGDGGGGIKGAQKRKETNDMRISKIQAGIGQNEDPMLQKMGSAAYRSLLGYHSTKIHNLGMNKAEMVDHVNTLAVQMGFKPDRMPFVSQRVADTLKLQGIQGLNVGSDRGDSSGGGRDRGSSYGSGGGGRGYGSRGDSRGRGGGRGDRGSDRGGRGSDRSGQRQSNSRPGFQQRWETY